MARVWQGGGRVGAPLDAKDSPTARGGGSYLVPGDAPSSPYFSSNQSPHTLADPKGSADIFHIYFLAMFHVFSLVCFLIYGIKRRSGHD